jgi:hypothetical protein
MRSIERAAAALPTKCWPAIAVPCHIAVAAGARARRLNTNGNLAILLKQRDCHLKVLVALLRHRRTDSSLIQLLDGLHDTYWNADDRNGAANCTISLALAKALADYAGARILLRRAEDEYRQATRSGLPIPSGQALLEVADEILSRLP